LAKEESGRRSVSVQSLQLFDDSIQKYRLAFTGITPDPEETIALTFFPFFECLTIKNPSIAIFKKSTLAILDALFVVARIGRS